MFAVTIPFFFEEVGGNTISQGLEVISFKQVETEDIKFSISTTETISFSIQETEIINFKIG